jgi:NodT family efflux transporter outer membrane factor (OMF) lipoprotein
MLLASCTVHRVAPEPAVPVQVPATYAQAGDPQQPADDSERWWESFDDEHLNDLVTHALSDNFGLRQAWARLDAARAAAGVEGARLWPQVSIDAGAARDHTAVPGGSDTIRTDRRWVTPAAAYELDLWGGLHSLENAAGLEAQASRADLDTAAMTLAAGVADVYFAALEQRARRELIRKQAEVNDTFLELTELRFGQGLASALDIYQQRQLVAATTATLPLVDSRLQVLEHQLAVLLGQAPQAKLAGDRAALPDLPPAPAAGIPADLLQRRPDVRAAQHRTVAADHRVAAAIADRFPTVRLSASLPFQAEHTGDLFDEFVSSLSVTPSCSNITSRSSSNAWTSRCKSPARPSAKLG